MHHSEDTMKLITILIVSTFASMALTILASL
jgi:hypothetical protein